MTLAQVVAAAVRVIVLARGEAAVRTLWQPSVGRVPAAVTRHLGVVAVAIASVHRMLTSRLVTGLSSTTKVVMTLPQTTPFTEVSVEPVAGWDVTVGEAPLPTRPASTAWQSPRHPAW